MRKTKIAIVGAGNVGSTIAYTLMLSNLSVEICLIDVNAGKARGDALDIMHGSAFLTSSDIYAGDYSGCTDADIIIITAGAKQNKDETRMDLLTRNKRIFHEIISGIKTNVKGEPILLIVSNPVDIITYMAYIMSGYSRNKVIGSGTVLDSSRFRYMIGKKLEIDPRSVHAYIIGEHGDSEVPAWSRTSIGGMRFDEYCQANNNINEGAGAEIFQSVRDAAYEVINLKGATYYAIALSVRRIMESIIRDENSILPVSCVFDGELGIKDVAISMPAILGKNGIEKILPVTFSDEETAKLVKSADILKKNYSDIH